jgi:hypothetical protein
VPSQRFPSARTANLVLRSTLFYLQHVVRLCRTHCHAQTERAASGVRGSTNISRHPVLVRYFLCSEVFLMALVVACHYFVVRMPILVVRMPSTPRDRACVLLDEPAARSFVVRRRESATTLLVADPPTALTVTAEGASCAACAVPSDSVSCMLAARVDVSRLIASRMVFRAQGESPAPPS